MGYDEAVSRMLVRAGSTAADVASGFPHYGDPITGEWTKTADGDWTGAFFVGQLWLAAAVAGDSEWKDRATAWCRKIRPRVSSDTIFRGFLFWYGAGLGARLLDDDEARECALSGARALASSYVPQARLLPLGAEAEEAHSVGASETNIDGVPGGAILLYWAASETGDDRLARIAFEHTKRHIELLVRPEGSVVQSASLDPVTGELLRTYTHKGIRDDSTWARAQSWAMLGCAQAAKYDGRFIDDMERVCDWAVDHLPVDGVMRWDFDADKFEPEPLLDTSATAIAAAALVKAANLSERRQGKYMATARFMVDSLISRHLSDWGGLLDGCYNRRIGLAINNELVWGDYFLLESLVTLSDRLDPNEV